MVEHFAAQSVNAVDHLAEVGGDELAEHRLGDQRSGLAAQVADQQVEVDAAAGRLGRPGVILAIEVGELAAEEMDPLRPLDQVEEHPFPAADQPRPLPDVGEPVQQGVLVPAAALLGKRGVVETSGVGQGKSFQVGKTLGAGQRPRTSSRIGPQGVWR